MGQEAEEESNNTLKDQLGKHTKEQLEKGKQEEEEERKNALKEKDVADWVAEAEAALQDQPQTPPSPPPAKLETGKTEKLEKGKQEEEERKNALKEKLEKYMTEKLEKGKTEDEERKNALKEKAVAVAGWVAEAEAALQDRPPIPPSPPQPPSPPPRLRPPPPPPPPPLKRTRSLTPLRRCGLDAAPLRRMRSLTRSPTPLRRRTMITLKERPLPAIIADEVNHPPQPITLNLRSFGWSS